MKHDLESFEKVQSLAYEATSSIGKLLREGMTEKEACSLIETYCRDSGVKAFFHKPFAWFGSRSRYQDLGSYFQYLPTKTRLQNEDVVILDVAPILNGHIGDVGHTFLFETKSEGQILRARHLLLELRQEIPLLFESSLTTKEIWHKVDERVRTSGFDNIHSLYPFSVLGHRVHKVPFGSLPGITIPFGLQSLWSLSSNGIFPDLLGPNHRGSKTGVWAIEPHLGGAGFGAKFEELLVVEEALDGKVSARWLSDNVPHLKEGWLTV
jgi:Xaa-Pro aminopeptidase